MTHPPLARLTLYTRRMDEVAAFYTRHFGYTALAAPGDRIVELRPPGTGVTLNLHPMAKGQKAGQVLVKLVFETDDVAAFVARAAREGLVFGKPFRAGGYMFANAKVPAGNSISVTSRATAQLDLRPWPAADA